MEIFDRDGGETNENAGLGQSSDGQQVSGASRQVVLPGADNSITLPANSSIAELRADGGDLVIVLDDGQTIIVPDGAIVLPQVEIDGIAIPPINLAALLISSEPQPAAGPPPSSGGDFAVDPGAIQDAYAIGNLLPYTEFGTPLQPEQEVIPYPVNEAPEIRIEIDDSGVAVINAVDSVDEKGLPAREGAPAGSGEIADGIATNNSDPSEATYGFIRYDSPDGVAEVSLNGVAITTVGQTFETSFGILTITSIQPGAIGYDYVLTHNTTMPASEDNFSITITDTDGDAATATLRIDIIDDSPIARADTDSVPSSTFTAETGNVITGEGTDSGTAGADALGADNAGVSAVSSDAVPGNSDNSLDGSGNLVVEGEFGTLTINEDGQYSYVRAPGTPGGVSESFTYTLTDGDGSTSSATLTIDIGDAAPVLTSVPTTGEGTVVDESGLPARGDEAPGTDASSPSETTSGTITFTGGDGPVAVTINGVPVAVGATVDVPGTGTLVVTGYDPDNGMIDYSFTLSDNTSGDTTNVSFDIVVTDVDGDSAEAPFVISIVDDAPIAVDDNASQPTENASINVNVLANDIPGADSVATDDVAFVPGSLSGSGSVNYNGDRTFTYIPAAGEEGTVTFDYTISDGDGDSAQATVTIDLLPDSVPTIEVLNENAVFEAALDARPGEPAGSDPTSPDETTNGSFGIDTGGDTLASLVVNGVDVTAGGVVTTSKGVLTVSLNGSDYSYSYTLTDNTLVDPDSDSFSVVATDSDGDSASTTLSISIVDDVPTANPDGTFNVAEQSPLRFDALANDVTGADGVDLTTGVAIATNPTKGTVDYNDDGTFSYTPGAGEEGPDSFTYTITDGDGDTSTTTVTFNLLLDSVPQILSIDNLAVDEDGFAFANFDDSPLQANPAETDGSESLTDTGTAVVNFGADVPADLLGSIALLDDPAYDTQLETLDGNPVAFAIEGGELVGRDTGGAEVIRISIVSAVAGPNTGDVTYTYSTELSQPVMHVTADAEDTVTLSGVTFQVTDSDGSTGTGDFSVGVLDDVPTAFDEAGGSLAEGTTVAGTLDFVGGADGATVTSVDGIALVFGLDGYSQEITLYDATDTIAVGTIKVKADGSYNFSASDPLVNPVDAVGAFTVTDGDGDTATADIAFAVTDANTPSGALAQAAVDDDGLAGGNPASTAGDLDANTGDDPGDTSEATFTGTLNFSFGGDGAGAVSFGTNTTATVGLEDVSYSLSGNVLTATITSGARAGTDLFTVTLNTATGEFQVELLTNVLNAGGPNNEETDASASIAFVVTDADGSTANPTLQIAFDDDAPTASNVLAAQTTENQAFDIDITGSYAAGADGVDLSLVQWTQPAQGSVTYDGAGHFTYTPDSGAGSSSTSDSFTYTVVDGDGDTATATVSVTLQPDSTPVADDVNAYIDDDGLAAGNPASDPAGTDDDQDRPSETGAGIGDEHIFTGSFSVSAGTADGPLTYSLSSAAGTGTVGTENVDFTWDGPSNTLTATVAVGQARTGTVLFTVEITDVNTGAYSVTLVNPIAHATQDGTADDNTENNASVSLSYTVTDSDTPSGDSDTATLTINFDDDTPSASDFSAAQTDENQAFDISLAGHFVAGADGVDLATGVSYTQPSQGTVTYDNNGVFTYTPDPGAGSSSTADSFTYTVTDADGDSVTKTIDITLQPDSTPSIGTPDDLAVDEDGLGNANLDGSTTVHPTETDGGENLTDSGSVTVAFGNDVPGGPLLDSITLVDKAAYDTQLTTAAGSPIHFDLSPDGHTLIGYDAGNVEAIRITITGASDDGLGNVTYTYSTELSQPVQQPDGGGENTISLTGIEFSVTDSDGDPASDSFDVAILDDVPGIDVTATGESSVVLATQDAQTEGLASDSDASSAKFDNVFAVLTTDGADGATTTPLSYDLDVTNSASGLFSHGEAITLLELASGTVVGYTGGAAPTAETDAQVIFSVAVAGDGTVTLTQYQQVDHLVGETAPAYDDDQIFLADGKISLTASATITDNDNDSATDQVTIDLGGNLRFDDDGPSITGVSAGSSVTIDETSAGEDFATSPISATSGASVIDFTPDFGADGAAASDATSYTLAIIGGGATSLQTAIGDYSISLVAGATDNIILGQYTDLGGTHDAFVLTIGSDGKLTVDQYVALEHTVDGNTPADYDDTLDLSGLVNAVVTIEDFDGDAFTASQAIGDNIVFKDDGVDAVLDTDSIAAGSTGPATGNVVTNDYVGADGSHVTSVTSSQGTFAIAASGDTVIQGSYGSLTIDAGGNYSYTRNAGEGGGSDDVFTYTLTDNDGDYDTTTLTISIGDLVPIATTGSATVDDDGLIGGLPGGTGDIDANSGDLETSNEAIFQGLLGGTAGDGASTFFFESALTGTTETMGQETVTYTVSGGGTLLTAAITSSPDGRTGTLFTVEITDQATGAYTVTLGQPVLHTAGGDENDVDISIAYQISDSDGDFSAAPGSLSIQFNDDSPTAIDPGTAAVTNSATAAEGPFNLDSDVNVMDNYGADGPGTVRFTTDIASYDSGLTSNFQTVTYTRVDDTHLEAYAGADKIFTVTLDPDNGQYYVDMDGTLDSLQTIDFNNGGYNFTGGNFDWNGFVPVGETLGGTSIDNDSKDLLMTPIINDAYDGTVNTTAQTGGIGGGASVGSTEGFRIDFVIDLSGDQHSTGSGDYDTLSKRDHVFDSHYTANGAIALFKSTGGSTVNFAAFDDPDGNNAVGDGTQDTVTGVSIVWRGEAYDDGSGQNLINVSTQTVGVAVEYQIDHSTEGVHSFFVTLNGDGSVSISGIEGNGGSSLIGTQVAVFTADGYNSLEYTWEAGDTFQIGDFGVTTSTTDPVNFQIPVEIIDADGDTSGPSYLDITAYTGGPPTPPIVLDLDGNGVEFLSQNAGVTFDYAGTGDAVTTAWAAPHDGILAIDANGNGTVDDGSEIVFGSSGQTDLEGLTTTYDSNHDGLLDANDPAFAQFGVWQDADSDGVADPGEFTSLADLSIVSISLASDGQSYTAAGGDVLVAGTGTFTYADGSTGSLADAAFMTGAQREEIRTQQTSTIIAAAAASFGVVAPAAAADIGVFHASQVSDLVFAKFEAAVQHSNGATDLTTPTDVLSSLLENATSQAANDAHASNQRPSLSGETLETDSAEAHGFQIAHASPESDDGQPATDAGPVQHAEAQPVVAVADTALMEALLTLQPGNGSDEGANATPQALPAVAAVVQDTLAGSVVDQLVDSHAPVSEPTVNVAAIAAALDAKLGGLDQHFALSLPHEAMDTAAAEHAVLATA